MTDDDKRFPGDDINGGLFSHREDLETSDCKYFIKYVEGGSFSMVYCSLRGKIHVDYCLDCREYTNPEEERGIPDPNPF
ncbi:hypothetical protein AMET1_0874 [Methanonatronarchaeum thermophilum]|uniref:Uncharacterized protein n=1 Tax=Methanonatronarchaeum thermophilum TaxID=1927129 RepID=A0A1Y3GCN9_9EURY|nr:hypothetical protein [Methanonatronarchaeum thermophilum]OUJ19221.1 hypothetical protein AMET1_0874 [Methanonatronarchaeum thermophilum]